MDYVGLTADESKHYCRTLPLRADWEDVKLDIMHEVVKAKFEQNEELKEKLLATGDAYLEEGNWWWDRYWGVYQGEGENHLGKILMRVRAELR